MQQGFFLPETGVKVKILLAKKHFSSHDTKNNSKGEDNATYRTI